MFCVALGFVNDILLLGIQQEKQTIAFSAAIHISFTLTIFCETRIWCEEMHGFLYSREQLTNEIVQ